MSKTSVMLGTTTESEKLYLRDYGRGRKADRNEEAARAHTRKSPKLKAL